MRKLKKNYCLHCHKPKSNLFLSVTADEQQGAASPLLLLLSALALLWGHRRDCNERQENISKNHCFVKAYHCILHLLSQKTQVKKMKEKINNGFVISENISSFLTKPAAKETSLLPDQFFPYGLHIRLIYVSLHA